MSSFMAGIRTGVLIGLIALLIGVIVKRKNKNDQDHYDERQVAIRGMGYRYAFWTLAVELMLYGVNFPVDGQYRIAPMVVIFGMVFISGLVMIAYNVMHDAYYTLSKQRNKIMPAWIVIAVSNLAMGVSRISDDELWKKGMVSERVGLPLTIFAFFVVFFIILSIKAVIDRRELAE